MRREIGRCRQAEERGPIAVVDRVVPVVSDVDGRYHAGFVKLDESLPYVALRKRGGGCDDPSGDARRADRQQGPDDPGPHADAEQATQTQGEADPIVKARGLRLARPSERRSCEAVAGERGIH